MAKKIAFFTAAMTPTTNETTAINTLKAFEEAGFAVCVRDSQRPNFSDTIEHFDYIASTGIRPTAYANTGTYPAFNPAQPPNPPGYPGTTTVIHNGEAMPGTGGDFAPVVAGGVVTGGTWTPD